MSDSSRGRRPAVIALLLLLLVALAFLLLRCTKKPAPAAPAPVTSAPARATGTPPPPATAAAMPPAEERLTPATLQGPAEVKAGARFSVTWTGPDNPKDYVTIVRKDAAESAYANYTETREGKTLQLTAPIEPGDYELRYATGVAHKVLVRAPITVTPIEATLTAPAEAGLGTVVTVTWTGPKNTGDYITLVPKNTPDGRYGNYTETSKGSPLTVTAPVEVGDAELRYMTGQGARVLARRPIRITAPAVTLDAAPTAIAGTAVRVTWTGPNNPGDYITLVPKTTPDGRYGNYTDTSKGSPFTITAPIDAGDAELRYMTGQGAKILARRPLKIEPASITLEAPAEVVAGSAVSVDWTGPKNPGDYLTLVPRSLADGRYGNYTDASAGSPLSITAPLDTGDAEVRYMSGQGTKVLARRALKINAAVITLEPPTEAKAGGMVTVTWTGPNNRGDYLTLVPKAAKDNEAADTGHTTKGSPLALKAPAAAGPAEVRYISGQGGKVLARADLTLKP